MALSTTKQALLERWKQGRKSGSTPAAIPRRGEVHPLPLSFPQERLWFRDKFDAGRTAYNIGAAFRIRGPLELARLVGSLNAIVGRHEALRTAFREVDGAPVQSISSGLALDVPVVDLGEVAVSARDARLSEIRRAELQCRFDLTAAPLLRLLLARFSDLDHVLVLTRHHIVADAWSLSVFAEELLTEYDALAAGSHAMLDDLPVQYADFALWQRRRCDEEMSAQIDYWMHQLENVPRSLDLPFDRRPTEQTGSAGALLQFPVPQSLAAAVKSLGRAEQATDFMTLLTAFQVLLARYCRSDHVLVGCPIANRTRRELERLIGTFANTIVIRADLSGDPSFRQLLQQVRWTCLGAYANQDVPFERLVERLQPQRASGRSPVFQAMFVLQDGPAAPKQGRDLTIELIDIDTASAMFDLTLGLNESARGFDGALEYNTDLFASETMARLARQYVRVLEEAVARPDAPMSTWAWLAAEERAAVLTAAGSAPSLAPTATVLEQFAAHVAARPDAIAVCDEQRSLSYAALDRAAARVARVLRARAVGPEVRVGVCLERSVDLVTALLGVWRAGGAYVPIDPATPRERLAWLLADAGTPVVVTEAALRERVPLAEAQVVVLPLADEAMSDAAADEGLPGPAVHAGQLAYVIYTSGSTGTPKGILVSHANLARSTTARLEFYDEVVRTFLLVSPVTFDSSVAGLFWTLCSGGTLLLPSATAAANPRALGELIRTHTVSHVLAIPALYRSLLDDCPAHDLTSLETVVVAGEACPGSLIDRHYDTLPGAQLVNEYGPTEATVWSTAFRCQPAPGTEVPIGTPIPGIRAYVVDPHLELVPRGVVGELCLAGAAIARGYSGRPDLTAERFVPDPFASTPGERMYRTGDLVRWPSDGQLEFVGRSDRQIKLLGVRIELAELEAVIGRHPQVAQAAVTLSGIADERQLAAFVVMSPTAARFEPDLGEFVRRHVPRAMWPATLTVVDRLPRLSNGKVDYAALPRLDRAATERAISAPRTQTEQLVAQIWTELLARERIDVDASFFELGGHSLLAARVLSRVSETFGVDVQLREFFDEPTIARLASQIEAARSSGSARVLPPIVPRTTERTEFPLSFAQERLWFLERMNPGTCTYNVPTAARLRGALDRDALSAAFGAVVQRHYVLRSTFAWKDGQSVQRVGAVLGMPLSFVDLRSIDAGVRQDALDSALQEEARRPFDLTEGPLLRALLLQVDTDDHVLLVTAHHIISDAWSLNVLFGELGANYAGALGQATSLPPLPLQYVDYARWQRECLDADATRIHLDYWRKQLAEGTTGTELRPDRPRPPVPTMRGTLHGFELTEQLTDGLTRVARDARVTPFMLFLSGFAALLHRYTEDEHVVVGAPVAGRRRSELEGLMGFFVNMIALRVDCSGDPSFADLLRRTRSVCLKADAHQDVPFEQVVEAVRPARDVSRQPLFQVAIAVQNAPNEQVYVPGLTLTPMPLHTGTAKFDVTLTLTQHEQRWHGALEYNTDLFASETMARLARQYVRVLEEAVARPDAPMSTWAWLAAEERAAVLAAAGGAASAAPTTTVLEQFAAQVAARPDAIAVCDGQRSLSYAALDRAAAGVARGLRARGVGPEVRVGVCLERSIDLVTALLGVWRAGGAYVPIDPATPRERLAWLLADAGTPVVVTEAALRERVPLAEAQVVVLPLADEAMSDAAADEGLPGAAVHADQLAYVIYTSGSTGTPKGVLVTHANVVRLFSAAQELFQFDHHDVWTLFHSAAFDFSVWELWGALVSGGRVVVVSRDVQRSPHDFFQLLLAERVTVLNQTPSAFRHLARAALAAEGSDDLVLRLVIFGGEAVDVSQLTPWFERFGDTHPRLVNMYGITETTVHVTFRQLRVLDLQSPSVSPIGRPLPDLSTVVLDRRMQPVPPGVPGELYVGGAGVARGYLGRADLTAERFLPDPFSQVPGARLYRSGDRARLRSDGEFEYLGRVDHQLKVRGFRIESGEIEAILSSHAAVAACAVVGRTDQAGETQIAAYIEPRGEEAPHPEQLRAWLSERLPEYMLPAAFVFLPALPRTAGGKVDRKALPEPRGDRPELESEYVAPKGALEQNIAALWSTVLHLDKVGVRDNFFSLGGNSLRLAHLHGLLETRLATEVPMVTLFKHPTIRSFAEFLQTGNGGTTSVQHGHARATARRASLGQQRFTERHERRTAHSGGRRQN